ncbi:hypothetical protein BG015_007468 [Linnemannia schmuckeri]|uniref:F-box domain-containing protein n=1 Tax=Linnemannia schmuckeri TaxID=64567 RepID=A0A9P5S8G4_9FUNG|nr:hypothetical protein BG015_007468 [Linnemannia schmuckeri]
MSRPHALELPEILSLISQHLTHKDLYACVQVSRSFHLAFSPHLWSTVLVQPPRYPKRCFQFSSQQAITRYKHLIQGLHLLDVFPHNYLTAFEYTLQELHVSTLHNVLYDTGVFKGTLRQILKTISMNANSLRYLKLTVIIPDQSVDKNKEVWETLTHCRDVKTLEIASLSLSLHEVRHFWEICGIDYGGGNGTEHSLHSTASLPQRSVALKNCPMDEWPDDLCDDESFTLPFITSLRFTSQGLRNRVRMSSYTQGRLMRRCINLRSVQWFSGDERANVLRAERWNHQGKGTADWFFAGLLGDISEGPERYWKAVENMEGDVDSATGAWWPYLDTIDFAFKPISDVTCARLLRRLYRLETLRWKNPLLNRLSMEELFRERAPFQSTQDPARPSLLLSPPRLAATTSLPQRLCTTLKNLDLSGCHHVPSDDIHRVLESCPVLEEFRAEVVNMSNILRRPEWVCRGIRILSIGITFVDPSSSAAVTAATAAAAAASSTTTTSTTPDPPSTSATATIPTTATIKELEWAVFTRLSQLYRIKSFVLAAWHVPTDAQILQMKLGYGLELLSGWGGSIETLLFSYPKAQNMVMDDIQWILDHWPTLKAIIGRLLNADEDIDKEIKKALTNRGVKLEYPYVV